MSIVSDRDKACVVAYVLRSDFLEDEFEKLFMSYPAPG
jgi:hypothetical protein